MQRSRGSGGAEHGSARLYMAGCRIRVDDCMRRDSVSHMSTALTFPIHEFAAIVSGDDKNDEGQGSGNHREGRTAKPMEMIHDSHREPQDNEGQ